MTTSGDRPPNVQPSTYTPTPAYRIEPPTQGRQPTDLPKRNRWPLILATVGGLVVILAATTGIIVATRHEASPIASETSRHPQTLDATPAGPQAYGSARELAQALTAGGVDCATPEYVTEPANGATEIAQCGDDDVAISMFTNADEVEGNITYMTALLGGFGLDVDMVVGPNWSVQCGTSCTTVVSVTHGKRVIIEGEVGG